MMKTFQELREQNPCEEERIANFQQWLVDHGARFPKLSWPRNDTPSGIRGTIATDIIETGEVMVEIPSKLMMSPPHIFEDVDIGQAVKECMDVLHGDLLLAVYIMHELRKGSRSFYKPYLDILPEADCISQWSNSELLWLQDEKLYLRAKNRRLFLQRMYNRTILSLNLRFPNIFPLEEFPLESFVFSWNTIQARAFGKRLPWTALVPFSDCLNHSNVQTKYDFDVDSNKLFRLFPTGDNFYGKGSEVFNSYGRRSNENLLLDYGFSMLDNEWDDFEIQLCADCDEQHFPSRSRVLNLLGFSCSQVFYISRYRLPLSALVFLRVVCCDGDTLNLILDELDQLPIPRSDVNLRSYRIEAIRLNKFYTTALEISVYKCLMDHLKTLLGDMDTSSEQDERLFRDICEGQYSSESSETRNNENINFDSDSDDCINTHSTSTDRIRSAIVYRLTRKRILQGAMETLTELINTLRFPSNEIKQVLTEKLYWKHQVKGQNYNQQLLEYLSQVFDSIL